MQEIRELQREMHERKTVTSYGTSLFMVLSMGLNKVQLTACLPSIVTESRMQLKPWDPVWIRSDFTGHALLA